MIKKLFAKYTSNQLFYKSAQSFSLQVVGLGISFLLILFISTTYGAEKLGLYSMALVALQIGGMVSLSGLDTAAVKFVSQYFHSKLFDSLQGFFIKSVLFICILGIIVSSIIFFSSSFIAVKLMKNAQLTQYLQAISWAIIPYSVTCFLAECFRGMGNFFLWILFRNMLVPALYLILLIVFMWLPISVTNLSAYYAAVSILGFLASVTVFFVQLKKTGIPFRLQWNADTPNFRDVRKVAFPMFMFSSSLMLNSWLNTIMVGALASTKDIGLYRVIERLSALGILVLQAVNAVIAPNLATAFSKNNYGALKHQVQSASKLIFWASLPVQLAFLMFAPYILGFFGSEFVGATQALYIITVGQLVNSMTGPVSLLLNMTSYQKFLRNVSFFCLLISATTAYMLIPKWGINGVAFASLINIVLINLIGMGKVRKVFGFWSFYFPGVKVK